MIFTLIANHTTEDSPITLHPRMRHENTSRYADTSSDCSFIFKHEGHRVKVKVT